MPADAPSPARCVQSLLSSCPRGARRARWLAVRWLEEWGWPPRCVASQDVALLVSELATNAVLHGGRPGWYFGLRLAVADGGTTLLVEVTDVAPEQGPTNGQALAVPGTDSETGRGMLLVDTIADRWGVRHADPFTKTVWCQLDLGRPEPSGR
ncbi:hypothetical protein AQ490_24325 [Wenjunlia vitaminophila]|uniref:Histidine kinase/HSP90-like ATPase domain-containing protein n=1 Tax=Wenjunlia vitaminophila TaxID=76728 RepID=A0A0T6LSB7_WENVI|nr:hypothetical protein AQ490_24325 [Wenjunlia vitaminophila]